MTDQEYRLARAKILRERETAERLGCKRVIADCKHRLQELETKRFDESKRSCRYDSPSIGEVLHDDSLLPTMKFLVTFSDGRQEDVDVYSKPNVGLSRKEMEQDFITDFNAKIEANAPIMAKAHLILLRGGRKTPFELACQRIGERFEAMQLARRYRQESKVCT